MAPQMAVGVIVVSFCCGFVVGVVLEHIYGDNND